MRRLLIWNPEWLKPRQDRLRKLAHALDSASERDARMEQEELRVEAQREAAIRELHEICEAFAAELNRLLEKTNLELDPPEYSPAYFRHRPALMQLNIRGRILMLSVETPEGHLSREAYHLPYILQGWVRSFNQELLEANLLEEQQLFYCVDARHSGWRYFEPSTHRTGRVDQDFLTALLKALL